MVKQFYLKLIAQSVNKTAVKLVILIFCCILPNAASLPYPMAIVKIFSMIKCSFMFGLFLCCSLDAHQ